MCARARARTSPFESVKHRLFVPVTGMESKDSKRNGCQVYRIVAAGNKKNRWRHFGRHCSDMPSRRIVRLITRVRDARRDRSLNLGFDSHFVGEARVENAFHFASPAKAPSPPPSQSKAVRIIASVDACDLQISISVDRSTNLHSKQPWASRLPRSCCRARPCR